MKKPVLIASLIAATAGVISLGVSAQEIAILKGGNWSAMVAENEHGHLLGNPEAETRLVEFMSYTCSHCATFAREGDAALKLAYVPTGKVSYEIRHLIRDPVDMTAALLTHCGDPEKFPGNHELFMARHDKWMDKARKSTQAQQSRWQFGTLSARFQAIASDLDFYEIMESRGYSRIEADRCLSDEAKANAIADRSRADALTYGLRGTPSFVLNGQLLEATHAWAPLQPQLEAAIANSGGFSGESPVDTE